jgi:hypothetical protein
LTRTTRSSIDPEAFNQFEAEGWDHSLADVHARHDGSIEVPTAVQIASARLP